MIHDDPGFQKFRQIAMTAIGLIEFESEEMPMAQDPTYTPEPDAEEQKKLGARLAAIAHSIEQGLEHPRSLANELSDLCPRVVEALLRRASSEYVAEGKSQR